MRIQFVTIGALLFLCSCFRNPATGKLQLDLLSESQEVELGKQAKQEAEQAYGIYKEKPELNQYVADIGKRLSAESGRPNLPWSYEIVDDASVNAFALPGGPVFITRGILGHLNTEAELAAVLGHETGHVAARHSANQMSKQQVAQIGLGIGSILSPAVASAAQVAGAGLQLLFLKYSRDDETQADELGFRYMTKVGYDPRQMIPLFEMLNGVSKEAGAGKTPEWLQTHPNPGNRLEATQQRLKTELKGSPEGMKVERDKYLSMIDGITFGEDPRQGFFKGDTFYHPDLKFQWKLPAGWAHQNTPQAVAAASPKQDAILQLSPAGKMSPDEAAQKLFSQQGIKAGQPVNVKGAKLARAFQAQTQQGVIEGVLAFFSWQGNTYLMAGYTPQGGLSSYANTFTGSMGSFGELTDSSALSVKPAKLKLIKLDRPVSVTEFQSSHPSSVKLEEVALINGVAQGGQIPAGYAKQIVGGTQ
ncbi:MAG TPA: M48 family metalloprotease [Myxococcales bacterium]|nr:M48 family metalloprotease [Myxococcales bacterium]